ncbi:MAG: SpoIIE family protein phosphatase [Acetobacteraceae bacterium]|nr:SpoIIE family protein phosphatase [Acetobacteraceae bacterium]
MLVVLHDSAAPTRLPLDDLPLTIGRTEPAGLVLNDVAVSRHHCRLDRAADRIMLTDLSSTNGTYVNGTPVETPVPLDDGAVIRVGAHTLRYHRRSRDETEEAAALDRELQDASDYVAAILPPPIRSGAVQAEWFFQPSTRLSGDAFGYRWLDERWFAVFLLDVAGHGAAAALHAVSVANVLRQRMLPDVDFCDPASVLRSLNRMFPMESHNDRFFTIWYGVYDSATRALRFASGGHHPGYLLVPDALPQPLATRNPAVGMAPDRPVASATVDVPPGSALHLFSDGVFEVVDTDGHQADLPTIVTLLPQASGSGGPRRLHEAIRALARPGPLDDDFSSLLLRFP